MPETNSLIRTKLRLPFTRPGLVPRQRLQEQMDRGLHVPLTVITAPAGFGKTTLLSEWVHRRKDEGTGRLEGSGKTLHPSQIAWLSLDKNDDQVGRFLSYLVAALQEVYPAVGGLAAQNLATSQEAAPEAVLTSLINDLDTCGREIVLVLDDYHFISSQETPIFSQKPSSHRAKPTPG